MKLRELSPIEYDTVYTYDLTGKVRFWDLEEEDLYELFRDGRTSSRFWRDKFLRCSHSLNM